MLDLYDELPGRYCFGAEVPVARYQLRALLLREGCEIAVVRVSYASGANDFRLPCDCGVLGKVGDISDYVRIGEPGAELPAHENSLEFVQEFAGDDDLVLAGEPQI